MAERYSGYSRQQLFGHIASELSRALSWKTRNKEYYVSALERALDIADTLKARCIGKKLLREASRFREVLSNIYAEERTYDVSLETLMQFAVSFV